MEHKIILKDLDAAVLQRWGAVDDCPNIGEIKVANNNILRTKSSIKQLKNKKKQLSAQFKNSISTNSGELNALKVRSHEISRQIKTAEKQLNLFIHQLENYFTQIKPPETRAQRFQLRQNLTSSSSKKIVLQKVIVIQDEFSATWDDYVQHHPNSSIYHLYCWRVLLKSVHKVNSVYLAALDDSQNVVGVLPAINLSSSLFGNYLVSLPYFNYGGPLAESIEIEKALLERAASISKEQNYLHFEVRATHPINDWPQKRQKVSMILSLASNTSDHQKLLGTKVRAQVKQARKNGLQTRFGGEELLDDFYLVFAQNMRDLGTPVYSKAFFKSIALYLSNAFKVVIVYKKKKPIAAGLLLAHHELLEIPWASSLRSYKNLNANMLMYAETLEYAIERGYDSFDFGRSSIDSPTFKFKKQWGAQPVQHYWHYWLPEGGSLPELNPGNPKYRVAINLWKKIPVWLTKIIGPRIAAYLP